MLLVELFTQVRKYMNKYYCSCKPSGKNFHVKFREVTVDKEGVCQDCGYYALESNPHDSYNLREERWEDTEEFRIKRDNEIGHYFLNGK